MTEKKLSVRQLFCILLLSRLFITFTYIFTVTQNSHSSDQVLAAAISWLAVSVAAVPSLIFISRERGGNIVECAKKVSRVFGGIVAVLYCLGFIWVLMLTGIRFSLFSGVVMFPESNTVYYTLILFAVSIYLVSLGLPAFGRCSGAVTLIVVSALLFVMFMLLPKAEYTNFTPVAVSSEANAIIRFTLSSLSATMEISALPVICSQVEGKKVRGFFIWAAVIVSMIVFFFAMSVAVLGSYGETQMFRLYSLVVMAEFGIFQRLDAFQSGIWTLCAVIKIVLYIFLASKVLSGAFALKMNKRLFAAVSAVSFVAVALFSGHLQEFIGMLNSAVPLVIFIVVCVLLPVVVLIALRVSKKKPGRTAVKLPLEV